MWETEPPSSASPTVAVTDQHTSGGVTQAVSSSVSAMLEAVSVSGIVVKNQQIGEAELTMEDRREELLKQYQSKPVVFLERYQPYLKPQHLEVFSHLYSDPRAQRFCRGIQRQAIGHTDKTRVQNLRYTSLKPPQRGPATPRGCPSARSTQRTPDKKSDSFVEVNVLPVTCGGKKGNLYIQQLAWGETCIECDGSWYSPRAFEKYGGRGSRKKWKSSILYEDQPLELLFKQGHLTSPFEKKNAESKKISPPEQCEEQAGNVRIAEEQRKTESDGQSSRHGEGRLHTPASEGDAQAIMMATLGKISDSQHRMCQALERLSSKQDTVIGLLQRLTDQDCSYSMTSMSQ